jgi:pilus assembly protein CpaB
VIDPATLRRGRRALDRYRRPAAALLVGLAALTGLSAARPRPTQTVALLSVARDLPAGTVLAGSDLREVRLPVQLSPAGALASSGPRVTGRVLAGAVRRGELLTDVRLVGRPLLAALPAGFVVAPVRLADAESADLLAQGDLVDVVAATGDNVPGGRSEAEVVAERVRVLTVPRPPTGSGSSLPSGASDTDGGALVLLAVRPGVAVDLARAAAGGRLGVVLRAG